MAFRAPPWAWGAAAVAISLFSALGVWQHQRGLSKERRAEALQQAAQRALVPLRGDTPVAGTSRVLALGTYLNAQLLQDGQAHAGRPGYHVWTPMRLVSGEIAIVNRGWVPQPANVAALIPPPAVQSIAGLWRALPQPGLRLAQPACEKPDRFPAVVIYPTAQEIACLLGEPVLNGLLLLDADLPGGYVRDWNAPGFPPERHYAYAAQWFAMAATVLALFVVLNLKRKT